jgi:hypothetical protein
MESAVTVKRAALTLCGSRALESRSSDPASSCCCRFLLSALAGGATTCLGHYTLKNRSEIIEPINSSPNLLIKRSECICSEKESTYGEDNRVTEDG